MKIAVASDDKINLALHFGRANGFILYDTEHDRIVKQKFLGNSFTGHSVDHSQNQHHAHHHSHRKVLDALKECDVVISHGMGQRMLNDLRAAGKEVFIASAPSADEAVNEYLRGNLKHDPNKSCREGKSI